MATPLTPLDALSPLERFRRRASVLGRHALREAEWRLRPTEFPRPVRDAHGGRFPHLWYEHGEPLARSGPDVDPVLDIGKQYNVALAAPAFDGVLLEPGRPLSFWRTLGPVTEALGYVSGMELRGGCIMPAIGGGLCLVSNALFRAAAVLGFDIWERHGHSAEAVAVPDGALWGLDATVFYPYVDLRVASPVAPLRLSVRVDDGRLTVRVFGQTPPGERAILRGEDLGIVVGAGGRIHRGRVWRSRVRGGVAGPEELLVDDQKRVVTVEGRRQHCGTCGKDSCSSRVSPVTVPAASRFAIRAG